MVDANYYEYTYGGVETEGETITRLLHKASLDVERLVGRSINLQDLSVQNQGFVKNAICSQAEFLLVRGETASSVQDTITSVQIGSYLEGKGYGTLTMHKRYSEATLEWLKRAGMLYTGVGYV